MTSGKHAGAAEVAHTVYYADIEGRRFKEIAELTDAPIDGDVAASRRIRLRHCWPKSQVRGYA